MTKYKFANTTRQKQVHSNKGKFLPHTLEELINVPHLVRGDWHDIRDLKKNVELLNRDLINLVEHVKGRNVHTIIRKYIFIRRGMHEREEKIFEPIALNDINEVILSGVAVQTNIGAVDAVLGADGLHHALIERALRNLSHEYYKQE